MYPSLLYGLITSFTTEEINSGHRGSVRGSDRSNLMQPKQLESAIRNNLDVIRKLRQTLHRRLSKRLYDTVSATKARRYCNSSSTGHLYVWSTGLSMRRSLRSLAGTDHEKASRGL